ncbi:conserved protein of unknown function [Shewanella benthica]|uniref:Uncharacterized protein n=1 Tax=Shewanella benthica TaxID=43661 RepID=A0A330M8C5_9GAMM|nr:tetratricopeptide repeat protein [Shewanella benthica]SQH77260.1 conserved protein of unknown function [Shewanella benthica]
MSLCLSYSLFCSALVGAHAQLDVRVQHMNGLLAPDSNGQLASQTNNANLRVDIWYYMGRMRLQSGMPDEAYNMLSKMIELDPSYESARLNLARTYIELNDDSAAVDEMDIFISLLPRPTPDQYIGRGNMAQQIDNDGEGLVIEGLNEGVYQLGPIVSLVDLLVDSYLEQGKHENGLNSINQMPEHRRLTPAVEDLRSQLEANLLN